MALATLGIEARLDGIEAAIKGLDNLADNSDRAEKSAKSLTSGVGLLKGALGALGVTLGLMAVKDAADNWSDLNSRLGLTVGGVDKATVVMQRLQSVAKNTYSDINTTTESFIANASVLRELGKSTAQALDYTEALNNALVVSGAKAETAASVQDALSKAMASGKLSGQNLTTVLEKGGRVTQALADELGVSTLALRQLGADGKITGDVLYNALTKRLEDLRDEANEMPATMGDAATAWSNAFTTIVGTVDAATGASSALAEVLYDLAYQASDMAGTIAAVFVTAQTLIGEALSAIGEFLNNMFGEFDTGNAMLIAGVGAAAMAFAALAGVIGGAVVSAFSALTAVILANPIGLLIGALAAAGTAAYLFRDSISQAIGVDVVEVSRNAANYMVGAFVGSYKAVTAVWDDLPAAFEYTWKTAVNSVLDVMIWWAGKLEDFFNAIPEMLGDAMENFPTIFANSVRAAVKLGVDAISWMVNKAIALLNGMLSGVRWLLDKVGIEMQEIGNVDIGAGLADLPKTAAKAAGAMKGVLEGMKLDISDSAKEAGDKIGNAYKEAFATDYVGAFTDKLGETYAAASDVADQFDRIRLDDDGGNGMGGALGDAGKGGKGGKGKKEKKDTSADRAAKKLEDEMERRLETLRHGLMSEEELRLEQYEKDLETLQWHLDNKKITEQEYMDWREQVERDHQGKLNEIRMQGAVAALDATADFFGALAGVMGGNNEKMLKMQRIFAAASALVNAYLAASQVLADPTIPFWGKFAAVAAVIAKGMSLVAAIKSGSKASASGGGSGANASSAPAEKAPIQQAAEITIHGEVFDREGVVNLIEKLNDAISDGHSIVVRTS